MENVWPLPGLRVSVPQGMDHPGSFGAVRKHDVHTGVDLYAPVGQKVVAIEDGVIVAIDPEFTGGEDTPKGADGEPIWHTTAAIMVEGVSGVILYGEVRVASWLFQGALVNAGQELGTVVQVLKEKPDGVFKNPANSPSMLHLEFYEHGVTKAVWWQRGEEKPDGLLDPTCLLLEAS